MYMYMYISLCWSPTMRNTTWEHHWTIFSVCQLPVGKQGTSQHKFSLLRYTTHFSIPITERSQTMVSKEFIQWPSSFCFAVHKLATYSSTQQKRTYSVILSDQNLCKKYMYSGVHEGNEVLRDTHCIQRDCMWSHSIYCTVARITASKLLPSVTSYHTVSAVPVNVICKCAFSSPTVVHPSLTGGRVRCWTKHQHSIRKVDKRSDPYTPTCTCTFPDSYSIVMRESRHKHLEF